METAGCWCDSANNTLSLKAFRIGKVFLFLLLRMLSLFWIWENGNAFGALKSWKENPLWS